MPARYWNGHDEPGIVGPDVEQNTDCSNGGVRADLEWDALGSVWAGRLQRSQVDLASVPTRDDFGVIAR